MGYSYFQVSKMKLKCGGGFTGKLEGMLNDLSLAHENRGKFDEWTRAEGKIELGSTMYYLFTY